LPLPPIVVLVSLLAGGPTPAGAAAVRITPELGPDQVQRVVDAAAPGDTVLVAPGEYGGLRLPSGVRLVAESGPTDTVFRHGRHAVIDATGTDSTTVLEGLTLDGDHAAEGVLLLEESQASVVDCVIRNGWSGVRGIAADPVVRNCVITGCANGVYLFECGGLLADNEIRDCTQGITLVSSSPRIRRNVIADNTLGMLVSVLSDPSVGGSLSRANRIHDNVGGAVRNTALSRRAGLRATQPLTLRLDGNYWGSDCPDPLDFQGPVDYRPWVDESGSRLLESCVGSVPR